MLNWLAVPTNRELCAVCVLPTLWFADFSLGKVQSTGSTALGACPEEPGALCALWRPSTQEVEVQSPGSPGPQMEQASPKSSLSSRSPNTCLGTPWTVLEPALPPVEAQAWVL